MILNKDTYDKYLEDYKAGKIRQGLGIDVPKLDDFLRYKQGNTNIVIGLDNVGKTVFMLWYYLVLSVKHDIKWVIWSGENNPSQLVRVLMEFYKGKKLRDFTTNEIFATKERILSWFQFVDFKGYYTSKDLFKIFEDSGADAALIDPYSGMNRGLTHADNYQFLDDCRFFTNRTNMTLYTNVHPNSEAARSVFSKDDIFLDGEVAGYQKPPGKAQSEGGQPFASRTDDFITLHRFVGHPLYQFKTMLYTRKIKDTETGGMASSINDPIVFDYNKGLGFTCDGLNPLGNGVYDDGAFEKLKVNETFDVRNDDGMVF